MSFFPSLKYQKENAFSREKTVLEKLSPKCEDLNKKLLTGEKSPKWEFFGYCRFEFSPQILNFVSYFSAETYNNFRFSVRIWWEILAKISLHWFNMASAPADQNYSRFQPNFTKCWYHLSRWVETVRCCRWCHWSLWDLDQKKGTVIFRLRLGTVGPSAKIKFLSWLP